MNLTLIAAATLGAAIAYGLGRVQGSRQTQDTLLDSLDTHGTIFVKVGGEDRVVTGYVETYGDWFKVKNVARAESEAALQKAREDHGYVEAIADPGIPMPPLKDVRIGADDLQYRPSYAYAPKPEASETRETEVLIKGAHGYEHPFLNTGSLG